MTLPKNETGILDSIVGTGSSVTQKRYSVFRIFLLTSYLVGSMRSFASYMQSFPMTIKSLEFLADLSLLFVAILFIMEPVSSVFFNYRLGGEVLSTRQYVGTFSILLAMISKEAGIYVRIRREAALG